MTDVGVLGPEAVVPVPVEAVLALRQAVLWPDLPLEALRVAGDGEALHLAILQDGAAIAVGSFYAEGAEARLRKLAVAHAYRGQGLGRAILRAGAARLREAGARVLWCDARQSALGFYRDLGFTIAGEVFEKSGVPYRRAQLSLDVPRAGP